MGELLLNKHNVGLHEVFQSKGHLEEKYKNKREASLTVKRLGPTPPMAALAPDNPRFRSVIPPQFTLLPPWQTRNEFESSHAFFPNNFL